MEYSPNTRKLATAAVIGVVAFLGIAAAAGVSRGEEMRASGLTDGAAEHTTHAAPPRSDADRNLALHG